jgi:class 3 adenylate cyclase
VYWRLKDYPKALEWFFKSLKIAEESGDKRRMYTTLGNIGGLYTDQGKYSEALEYLLKSLHIAEELNDKSGIAIQTGNIGGTYASLKQYNAALAYFFKAMRIAEETGDKQSIAIALGNAGEAYYLIAKDSTGPKPDSLVPSSRAASLARAVDYLNRGIKACRDLEFYLGIPEFSQYLSDALIAQGDYQGAIAAYKQSVAVKDSLYNTANNEKITNLETKRAVELKDKDIQIAKLKKRNERILSVSGFAVLLLILGILGYYFRKQRHSNRLLSKEKKRSDDLLLNILPAEVAEELKTHGGAQARQFDNVTVLFTDFVNFTGTAEQLGPQLLVRELHECFTAFDTIIEKNGLEKIKTVGDAYIAACGLPNADKDHAQKCVRAAIDILHFMEERSKREQVFAIRIGINSGSVVAGIVGVRKFAYDIWGDTVNTAARMEQHGEPGRINISQSTYELVKDDYRCQYRGAVPAKNKGEIPMYFVEEPAFIIA